MKVFDLQMFAEGAVEAVQGKQIVYLFRPLSDAKTKDASLMAFTTENERTNSKEAESTATKSGSIRTPGVSEIEITATAVVSKGDPMPDDLEKAMNKDGLIECWEVNLAEEGTEDNAGKFKARYFQGYLTEFTLTSSADGMAEYSISYGANGTGAEGYVTVTAEQQEIASYVFKDVTKDTAVASETHAEDETVEEE